MGMALAMGVENVSESFCIVQQQRTDRPSLLMIIMLELILLEFPPATWITPRARHRSGCRMYGTQGSSNPPGGDMRS